MQSIIPFKKAASFQSLKNDMLLRWIFLNFQNPEGHCHKIMDILNYKIPNSSSLSFGEGLG
jgi:hypothetical protein